VHATTVWLCSAASAQLTTSKHGYSADMIQQDNTTGRVCRSGFMTLPPVPLQEQPAMVLLLEGALVSWLLAMREYGGHEDLRGSDRRSIIPYIHG
jgi:hypothetical protein